MLATLDQRGLDGGGPERPGPVFNAIRGPGLIHGRHHALVVDSSDQTNGTAQALRDHKLKETDFKSHYCVYCHKKEPLKTNPLDHAKIKQLHHSVKTVCLNLI
jgi:hypothetical protein